MCLNKYKSKTEAYAGKDCNLESKNGLKKCVRLVCHGSHMTLDSYPHCKLNKELK